MRSFLIYLLLFNCCQGEEGWTYPQEDITYAGITIECDKGCGTFDDPDIQSIWIILENTIEEIFNNDVIALDSTGNAKLLHLPVSCDDNGDYERWDWQSTNGVWPSERNLIYHENIWIKDYPSFLQAVKMMREDISFYYLTAPKRVGDFEKSLISKLEEGLENEYNIYKIYSDGSIQFSYQRRSFLSTSLNPGWEWIDSELDHLSKYGYRHKKTISYRHQQYRKAEELINQSSISIDKLFRDLFVYCLKHHQPEGITFSTAIEALLAGNLTEGIECIRALIKIGESEQFHSDLIGKMHLLKGQLEIESSLYAEAIVSLTEAIAKNRSLKEAYLERATAYFELGKYDHSMEDYLAYTDQSKEENLSSIPSFSCAFAKNLPLGAYESGKGLCLFLSDLVIDPIHTARQVWESLNLLGKLAATKEWEELSKALAPEIHQLVVEWDNLSSEKRGELAGYAFGKYGTDLILSGALAKAVSKGLKCKTEVSIAYKKLRAADQTLLLESMAGCENTAKFAEAIKPAQTTVFLGEELGFTAKEMGQLKQAEKLEGTLTKVYDHLTLQMQESIALYKEAQTALKPYAKQPLPEFKVRELIHETGIPTFPRPPGIPEDFLVMISDRSAGMEYVHPTNAHIRIRVMPGKPHSPNLGQQKPYVIQTKSGKAFDKHGNLIELESLKAHIPLKEFIYRK